MRITRLIKPVKLRLLASITVFFLTNSAIAETWKDRRSALEESALFGKFRVFYSLSGKDSLPPNQKLDENKNSVPDSIESIGKRLLNADQFLAKNIGLTQPLESNRYKGKAHFIDVNILDFKRNKKGPKNGVAYDGIPKFNRSIAGEISTSVITMDLSSAVRLQSQTVEHELFHLYQNGYSYFKNRWYTEGTARWAELIMIGRTGDANELPRSRAEKLKLFQLSYGAKGFWNKIILLSDQQHKGKVFIKRLLEELDTADNHAAYDRKINVSNWKESEQRSELNNSYIWDALLRTALIINYNAYANEIGKLEKI